MVLLLYHSKKIFELFLKHSFSKIFKINCTVQSSEFEVGADSIIQVGSDSLLVLSSIYKFVITNCRGTIAYI